MRQIEHSGQLSALLLGEMKRGVVTNALPNAVEQRREIAAGSLWAHTWAGGLLLLHRRAAGWRTDFYLRDMEGPSGFVPDGPAVMEIAMRPRDEKLRQALSFWQKEGFLPLFRRRRLALPPGTRTDAGAFPVRAAGPGEREDVQKILSECFDPLTGCIPAAGELERELEEGLFLLALAPGGGAAGLLHMRQERQGTQLRHLAVTGPFRKRGAARSLLAAYLERTQGPSRVWVREDNAEACRFYEKNGYRPDGWTSTVLRMG